jgi:hypothetical protein
MDMHNDVGALGRFLTANIGSMWMVWSFDPGPFVIQLLEHSRLARMYSLEFSVLRRSIYTRPRRHVPQHVLLASVQSSTCQPGALHCMAIINGKLGLTYIESS